MLKTPAYAAKTATSPLQPFTIERREPGPHDVLIEILYCGVCHSDIHQARNEWGASIYPIVPGHEIVGRVAKIGKAVTQFKVGDLAGVGCFVDSCRKCENCEADQEQMCKKQCSYTYNSVEQDLKTRTYGGYSSQIVVDENYTLKISDKLPLAEVAPLLCAGITTYSPLRQYDIGKGHKVGIIGLGGLGHMGVKFAAAMGAEVTVFSTSKNKEADAKRLGAKHFVVSKNADEMAKLINHFDFILDTVSADHDIDGYLKLLGADGVLVLVGLPEKPFLISAFSLARNRRSLVGSNIGGIYETQEMLDYCAKHNITSDIEIIPIQEIEAAYERTIKADVRYRFVIDMKSLASSQD